MHGRGGKAKSIGSIEAKTCAGAPAQEVERHGQFFSERRGAPPPHKCGGSHRTIKQQTIKRGLPPGDESQACQQDAALKTAALHRNLLESQPFTECVERVKTPALERQG